MATRGGWAGSASQRHGTGVRITPYALRDQTYPNRQIPDGRHRPSSLSKRPRAFFFSFCFTGNGHVAVLPCSLCQASRAPHQLGGHARHRHPSFLVSPRVPDPAIYFRKVGQVGSIKGCSRRPISWNQSHHLLWL
ncbi:hypothetical protein LX36DRAFT_265647 [Colletotrichum falcatum]|nr:hypothetical protein LX36DRAFT_265647 [Colletotrichum falcatum]